MDKAKILRLLDKADDIVNALYKQGANKDYKCKSLREKLRAIDAEITAPPKSNADRIRQMTDEELADFLLESRAICKLCKKRDEVCGGAYHECFEGIEEWLKQEVSEDA